MIDFLIFYEVGVREFESIALLGYELKRRGYSVEYFGFEEADQNKYIETRKFRKRLYNNVSVAIMPSLYHDREIYNTVYYICGSCKLIVDLRWEQYFVNGEMKDRNSKLFPYQDAKMAYHLCWGEISRKSLRERKFDSIYTPVTGAIQLDFLRPEFKGFYLEKQALFSKYNLSIDKETVLYISSFTFPTMTERLKEAVNKDFDNEYNFNEKTFAFHKKSYDKTIDWIEDYLKCYPDKQFIYRPHPTENITKRIAFVEKKYKNFRIISDESVKQWILGCDIITTWVSTSIVEAYFAKKHCFIIRPYTYPHSIDICVYEDSNSICNEQEFLEISSENATETINSRSIERYYSVDNDVPSYIRTANFLEKIYYNGKPFPWNKRKMLAFDKKRKTLFVRNIVFYIYLLLLNACTIFYNKTKISFPRLIQSRIDNMLVEKRKNTSKKNSLRDDLNSTIDRVNRFMNKM